MTAAVKYVVGFIGLLAVFAGIFNAAPFLDEKVYEHDEIRIIVSSNVDTKDEFDSWKELSLAQRILGDKPKFICEINMKNGGTFLMKKTLLLLNCKENLNDFEIPVGVGDRVIPHIYDLIGDWEQLFPQN